MQAIMVGMLAETPLHPGSGQSVGAIDLPVQREATTDYPVIVGSSMKGALRSYSETAGHGADVDRLFGLPERIGEVGVTDAKILLLPLRTLSVPYVWVTCPLLLERFTRDLAMCGVRTDWEIPSVADGRVLTEAAKPGEPLFIEEYAYTVIEPGPQWLQMINSLKPLLQHPEAQSRVSSQLAVISNVEFHHFAQFGLAIRARNQLDAQKKSKNLWYEETLSPDTVFFFLCIARAAGTSALAEIQRLFAVNPYLQIGGNESVGEGWCVLSNVDGEEEA